MNTRRRLASLLAGIALLLAPNFAAAEGHSAVEPIPRGDQWWKDRAGLLDQRAAENSDTRLVFIGDSITQGWEGAGKEVWEERYAPFAAVNLGIGGDRTQHVLWRLQNGNLEGISPKLAVVMIGTNNSNGIDNTEQQIAEGVTAIVGELRERVPDTKVLLLGIFPRGENPNEQRGKLLQINQILAKLHDGEHVHFLDIGHHFVDAAGLIPASLMPDYLHLSPEGYEIWADAIAPLLDPVLGIATDDADVSGDWIFTIQGPEGEDVDMPMELEVADGRLSGRIARDDDRWLTIEDGTFDGDSVVFTVRRDRPQGGEMIYHLKGKLDDPGLAGTVNTEMNGQPVDSPWEARRP